MDRTKLRDLLNPSPCEESVARCMDGTRVNILKQVHDWVADDEAPNILWLKGSPGAGKSAIATSVVASLGQRRGPSFFFKRDRDDLNNPRHLWPTIAYDLALAHRAFRQRITGTMNTRGLEPGRISVEDQFKYLIEESAAACIKGPSPVVVLDGLDECRSDGDLSVHWKSLLGTIKKWSSVSKDFKLVVTSRDQHDIGEVLTGISRIVILATGNDISSETTGDVHRYVEQRLSSIRGCFGTSLPLEWPGNHKINELVTGAQGLFIWAKIALDCLEDDPETLDDILGGYLDYAGNPLDKLYEKLLERSFPNHEEKALFAFKMVAGVIVLAKTPLLISDIDHFLTGDLQPSTIRSVIRKLKAIISGSTSVPLRVCHQSLPDFLLDPKRSGNFAIDKTATVARMAIACLKQMNHEKEGLKFNILGLETSYRLNSDIQELEKLITTRVPSYLLYSCHFWMDHLKHVSDTSVKGNVLLDLRKFLHHNFLFWLEVRSLTGRVNDIPGIMRQGAKWIGVSVFQRPELGGYSLTMYL